MAFLATLIALKLLNHYFEPGNCLANGSNTSKKPKELMPNSFTYMLKVILGTSMIMAAVCICLFMAQLKYICTFTSQVDTVHPKN